MKSIYHPLSDEAKAKKRKKAIRKMKWKILLDFLAVLVFVLLLVYITYRLWSGIHYYPNSHASSLMMKRFNERFIGLEDVFNRTLFFSYLQNTFVRTMFIFRWYDDLKFPVLSPPDYFGRKAWTKDFVSRLLGVPRLRQLRVVEGFCSIPHIILYYVNYCNPPWSESNMDDDTYGVKWRQADWSDLLSYEWGYRTQWMYSEPKNTSVFPVPGKSGIVYPSGGYIMDLTVIRDSAKSYATTVEQEYWVDQRTRAIFLEFTLYNPNNRLFTQVTAIIEQMASGLFSTSSIVDSVHTLDNWSGWNLIYFAFLTLLFFRILYKMNRHGVYRFCKKMLNVYEVLVIAIGILSIVFYVVHLKASSNYLEVFNKEGLDRFFNFKDIINYFLYTKVFLWILFCLLAFRLFVSWYFGRTYVYFYNTFVLSKRWIVLLMLVMLFYFLIIWRTIGYVIDAMVFYNYRVFILYHMSYNYMFNSACNVRTQTVALILCSLSLIFQIIFFVMFTHYYQIGKRKPLDFMQYYNFLTFIRDEAVRALGKKKGEEEVADRIIHRKRDIKIPNF